MLKTTTTQNKQTKNSPLSHRPIIHSVCPSNFAFNTFTETIMNLVFTPAPAPPEKKNYINISRVVQSSQEKSKTMVILNTPIICSFSCSSEFLLHLQSSLNWINAYKKFGEGAECIMGRFGTTTTTIFICTHSLAQK